MLSVLVFGGDHSITEMAQAEQVRPPTMTRLIDGMERDGLVRRKPDPRDGRVVVVTATPRGRSVLEAARERRLAGIERTLAPLSATELDAVARAASILETLFVSGGGGVETIGGGPAARR
jgi:DNA-binding MarR family transcriptional regulator